jgi:4-hydroxybenzoate polyprenyltransferase
VAALFVALRPKQWVKNLFVFAALVLTGKLGEPTQTAAAVWGFVLFCAVSSAVYLVNDVADRESDRRHPVKMRRPIASGELSPTVALTIAAVLGIIAVFGGFNVTWLFGWVIVCYLLLQLAYTTFLKRMVIVEVLAIAGGFVLRVLGGGAAIHEPISPFLYLSVIFLALFQGFAKRRHELTTLADDAGEHRESLNDYTVELLDHLILIAATATIVTYSLYPIYTPHVPAGLSANVLLLTIPFVLYAIFRYLFLIHVKGLGGTPEEMLLVDKLLLLDVLAWAASIVVILYVLPDPAP